MKSNINEIIKNSFENQTPPDGHKERFIAKLNANNTNKEPKKKILFGARKLKIAITTVAAVILIMVGINRVPAVEVSEVICDEVCEFLAYTDSNIRYKEDEILTIALEKLSEQDYINLKLDLDKMRLDYENSQLQQTFLDEEKFIMIMNNIYKQQINVLDNIMLNINS